LYKRLGLGFEEPLEECVKWRVTAKSTKNNTFYLYFMAIIDSQWELISGRASSGTPSLLNITFFEPPVMLQLDRLEEKGNPYVAFHPIFEDKMRSYRIAVSFVMPVQFIKEENSFIRGNINYVIANDRGMIQTNDHMFKVALENESK